MDKIGAELATIAAGIIGLALVAVLVSRNAQTGSVLTSAGNAFGSVIRSAVSPVSGGSSSLGLGGLEPVTVTPANLNF